MARILIVEDDDLQRQALADLLRQEGHEVVAFRTGEEALEAFPLFDLALVDLRLPGMDGLALLKALKSRDPEAEVILITAYGTVETAVEAMKQGAYDYITKPLDFEELRLTVERALQRRALEQEVRFLREELSRVQGVPELIAESPAMKEVMSLVARVGPTNATVLIRGESGVGKEVIARAIHQASRRKKGRFVAVSVAAIPETLLEAELFGYEKGAFTGAARAKPGKFELASGGTLFLDEIGDMPLALQVKLLRALQEREIERLGGIRPIPVDVRIIAATHRDLEALIREGRFREDLYYRLNVVTIWVPPLRERREDILPLAHHFLRKYAEETGKPVKGFTREAERLLLEYPWLGNVRELENAVERAVVLTRNAYIGPEDLPMGGRAFASSLRLEDVEREHILRVLRLTQGNLTRAAELLGIHRNTLREKIRRYGLKPPF